MSLKRKLLGLAGALAAGTAVACATFGTLSFAMEVSTNPSSNPRGFWNEIGSGLASTYPQHQQAQGHVIISYKYCAGGIVCARYGATVDKPCGMSWEQTADAIGQQAEQLLGYGGGSGDGLMCSYEQVPTYHPRYVRTQTCGGGLCRTEWVQVGVTTVYETVENCG